MQELIQAIASNDLDKIKKLLSQPDELDFSQCLKSRGENLSILSFAISTKNQDIIDVFLNLPNLHELINGIANETTTPFYIAAKNGDQQTMVKLLNHGAEIPALHYNIACSSKVRSLTEGIHTFNGLVFEYFHFPLDPEENLDQFEETKKLLLEYLKTPLDPNQKPPLLIPVMQIQYEDIITKAVRTEDIEFLKELFEFEAFNPLRKNAEGVIFLKDLMLEKGISAVHTLLSIDKIKNDFTSIVDQESLNEIFVTSLRIIGKNEQFDSTLLFIAKNLPLAFLLDALKGKPDQAPPIQKLIEHPLILNEMLALLPEKERLPLLLSKVKKYTNIEFTNKVWNVNNFKRMIELLPKVELLNLLRHKVEEPDSLHNILYSLYKNSQYHLIDILFKHLNLPTLSELPISESKISNEIYDKKVLSEKAQIFNKLALHFPNIIEAQKDDELQFKLKAENTPIHSLFINGESASLEYRAERARKSHKDQEGKELKGEALVRGPLPKNKYTLELERLIKDFLKNPNSKIKKSKKDNHYYINVQDERGTVNKYDITTLLKYANLQHLSFTNEDLFRYEFYVRDKRRNEIDLAELSEIRKEDRQGNLKDLSYPEMIAINLYSSEMYGTINDVLRGELDSAANINTDSIIEMLVHGSIASFGASKIPNTAIDVVYRTEDLNRQFSKERHIERLKAIEKGGGTVYEPAFTSTSAEKLAWDPKQVLITINGGLFGKDIRLLSQNPDEREYLIPPAQFYWYSMIEEGEYIYLFAMPVRSLNNLPKEMLQQEENIPLKMGHEMAIDLYIILESMVDLKKALALELAKYREKGSKNVTGGKTLNIQNTMYADKILNSFNELENSMRNLVNDESIDTITKYKKITENIIIFQSKALAELNQSFENIPSSIQQQTNKNIEQLFRNQRLLIDDILLSNQANQYSFQVIRVLRRLEEIVQPKKEQYNWINSMIEKYMDLIYHREKPDHRNLIDLHEHLKLHKKEILEILDSVYGNKMEVKSNIDANVDYAKLLDKLFDAGEDIIKKIKVMLERNQKSEQPQGSSIHYGFDLKMQQAEKAPDATAEARDAAASRTKDADKQQKPGGTPK